jgi:hypothetical protein
MASADREQYAHLPRGGDWALRVKVIVGKARRSVSLTVAHLSSLRVFQEAVYSIL